jgi:hypothetical protein
VWEQEDDFFMYTSVHANRYVPDSGWQDALRIDNGTSSAYSPDVALNPDGYAVAVWYQYGSAHYNIYAKRYVPGFGWEGALEIDNEDQEAFDPRVALNPEGYAVAVWKQHDGSFFNIYGNRFIVHPEW